jgi:hypothetical protein
VDPGATGVTTPVGETTATALLSALHVMERPVRTLPSASRSVAVACVDCASVMVLEPRATLTVAIGTSDTVIDELPLWLSLVAVIVAAPGTIAVTSPVVDTDAIDGLLDDHVTVRPVRTLS